MTAWKVESLYQIPHQSAVAGMVVAGGTGSMVTLR